MAQIHWTNGILLGVYKHISLNKQTAKLAAAWQNRQNDCAPSKDSDQPWHQLSLIRVFAVRAKKHWTLNYLLASAQSDQSLRCRMKKHWALTYLLSAQWRLWSDWADAQADLSLRWSAQADLSLRWSVQANLSLRWAHMSFCGSNKKTKSLGTKDELVIEGIL